MDLAKFLEARIADDEALGRRDLDSTLTLRYSDADSDAQWLIAEFDAERVLREVDAKRKILAEHQDEVSGWDHDVHRCMACGGYTVVAGFGERGYQNAWPCLTLRALAAVWSDHPEYDESWR